MQAGRMLKKSACFVLESFKPSTLSRIFSDVGSTGAAFPFAKIHFMGERPTQIAVCTSSGLHALRPCWTALLSILWRCDLHIQDVQATEVLLCRNGFSAAC
jgi:hypothetical protein